MDLEFVPLTSSWSSVSSSGPIVYDSSPLELIFSGNSSVASNYNSNPLDCDLGCTSCNLVAFGDFGDLGGEVYWLPIWFGNVSGSW